MWKTGLLIGAIAVLLAAGCGSDSSDDGETQAAGETTTTGAAAEPTEASDPSGDTSSPPEETAPEQPDEPAPPPPAGGAAATVTLQNGEVYEFPSILCTTEPQIAAGSEILFTAVSSDDPGLDITQFGNEGPVTELSVVTVYDGDFNTLYEASSTFEAFGGNLTLDLDGSTITGTGDFYPAADPAAASVPGEVTANC